MTWMELEGIMLNEINQSEKDKHHMILLMWNLRNKTNDHRRKKGRGQTKKQTLNYREHPSGDQRAGGGG